MLPCSVGDLGYRDVAVHDLDSAQLAAGSWALDAVPTILPRSAIPPARARCAGRGRGAAREGGVPSRDAARGDESSASGRSCRRAGRRRVDATGHGDRDQQDLIGDQHGRRARDAGQPLGRSCSEHQRDARRGPCRGQWRSPSGGDHPTGRAAGRAQIAMAAKRTATATCGTAVAAGSEHATRVHARTPRTRAAGKTIRQIANAARWEVAHRRHDRADQPQDSPPRRTARATAAPRCTSRRGEEGRLHHCDVERHRPHSHSSRCVHARGRDDQDQRAGDRQRPLRRPDGRGMTVMAESCQPAARRARSGRAAPADAWPGNCTVSKSHRRRAGRVRESCGDSAANSIPTRHGAHDR